MFSDTASADSDAAEYWRQLRMARYAPDESSHPQRSMYPSLPPTTTSPAPQSSAAQAAALLATAMGEVPGQGMGGDAAGADQAAGVGGPSLRDASAAKGAPSPPAPPAPMPEPVQQTVQESVAEKMVEHMTPAELMGTEMAETQRDRDATVVAKTASHRRGAMGEIQRWTEAIEMEVAAASAAPGGLAGSSVSAPEKLERERQKQSQPVKRGLPRPTARPPPASPSFLAGGSQSSSSTASTGGMLQQAEDLLHEEMMALINHDAFVHPTKQTKPPKKLVELQDFKPDELARAEELLSAELSEFEALAGGEQMDSASLQPVFEDRRLRSGLARRGSQGRNSHIVFASSFFLPLPFLAPHASNSSCTRAGPLTQRAGDDGEREWSGRVYGGRTGPCIERT
ncbi:unnamed protein product [Prorocentrum cordatum]|uniref:Pre-mRNA splicing factor component Cdc5p/Cef1 C-terminal domain-containing protein n=1 Tax=Prorocentrum cordatum TaxID=2364126 RepID=A0ABN9XU68_9DINO|nr:unnamed protein product [Polarella glacialis]